MGKLARGTLAVGMLLALGGCVHVHHHHRHHHGGKALEQEHQDATIVIVKEKPGPKRHCWRHHRHWHCHRR